MSIFPPYCGDDATTACSLTVFCGSPRRILDGATGKLGRVVRSEGTLAFNLCYFQDPRYDLALELKRKQAGEGEFGYIPASLLGRPP